jgi:hypothetical protein
VKKEGGLSPVFRAYFFFLSFFAPFLAALATIATSKLLYRQDLYLKFANA